MEFPGQELDPSCSCNFGDQTCVLALQRCCWSHCATAGTPWIVSFTLSLSLFFFLRAAPATYGDLQAGGQIRAVPGELHCSHSNQCRIQAVSVTYTIAHGNARSPTHWVRPGIEPTTSWFLVRFVSAAPRQELLLLLSNIHWEVQTNHLVYRKNLCTRVQT